MANPVHQPGDTLPAILQGRPSANPVHQPGDTLPAILQGRQPRANPVHQAGDALPYILQGLQRTQAFRGLCNDIDDIFKPIDFNGKFSDTFWRFETLDGAKWAPGVRPTMEEKGDEPRLRAGCGMIGQAAELVRRMPVDELTKHHITAITPDTTRGQAVMPYQNFFAQKLPIFKGERIEMRIHFLKERQTSSPHNHDQSFITVGVGGGGSYTHTRYEETRDGQDYISIRTDAAGRRDRKKLSAVTRYEYNHLEGYLMGSKNIHNVTMNAAGCWTVTVTVLDKPRDEDFYITPDEEFISHKGKPFVVNEVKGFLEGFRKQCGVLSFEWQQDNGTWAPHTKLANDKINRKFAWTESGFENIQQMVGRTIKTSDGREHIVEVVRGGGLVQKDQAGGKQRAVRRISSGYTMSAKYRPLWQAAKASREFKVGEVVDIQDKYGKWHSGAKVLAVLANGNYSVQYRTGTSGHEKKPEWLRKSQA